MSQLVFIENQQVVTDSLTIAEVFNKEHFNVTNDIKNQIAKLIEAGEKEWSVLNFQETHYQHPQNKQWYTKINMTEDGFTLVAMSYVTPEAMKMKVKFIQEFKKMREFLQNQAFTYANSAHEFEKHLIGAKYASEILRVDGSSKIRMLQVVHEQHGVPTNHLPMYAEEELKVSLTQLLKEHDIKMSAAKVNTKLIELGLLEIKERPSSKGGVKEFKSLTEKGLYYGSNAISPQNSKETQPLYYPSKFNELLQLILGQANVVVLNATKH